MGPPTIRRVADDEVESVAALLLRANEEHLSVFPPDVARSYRLELADVAGRLPFAEIYVAVTEGRPVGSVTYLPDAALDDHPWPEGGAVLRLLAVDPGARGRGLGRRLTAVCIDRAREQGAGFLALHTAPLMAAARHLYEGLGFTRTPVYDFDPAAHYGEGGAQPDEPLWGLAYLLSFDPHA